MSWFPWPISEVPLHFQTVKWRNGYHQGFLFQEFSWSFLARWSSCCKEDKWRRNWNMLWPLSYSLLHIEFSESWVSIFSWREEVLHIFSTNLPGCLVCPRTHAASAARSVLTDKKTIGPLLQADILECLGFWIEQAGFASNDDGNVQSHEQDVIGCYQLMGLTSNMQNWKKTTLPWG